MYLPEVPVKRIAFQILQTRLHLKLVSFGLYTKFSVPIGLSLGGGWGGREGYT